MTTSAQQKSRSALLRSLLESRWHGPCAHGRVTSSSGWPSGIPALDQALAPQGFPQGRLIEIFGERSCGKTTVAYALLAACTAAERVCAYVDPEHGFFAPAAHDAGIALERIIVVRPRDPAGLRRSADALVRSGACAIVVLDGRSASELQTHHYARLIAQAEKTGTTLVALSRGENPALASFATLRLWMRGLSALWQKGDDGGDRLSGYGIGVEIVKARSAAAGKCLSFASPLSDVAGTWPLAHAEGEPSAASSDAAPSAVRAAAAGS
jgi:hypothetical protein